MILAVVRSLKTLRNNNPAVSYFQSRSYILVERVYQVNETLDRFTVETLRRRKVKLLFNFRCTKLPIED